MRLNPQIALSKRCRIGREYAYNIQHVSKKLKSAVFSQV